jgi:UDP-N-acetylmuramyl pentapeptide phosphotransferase/UDP-N-acetylglucosamine-1-phosphate transferase
VFDVSSLLAALTSFVLSAVLVRLLVSHRFFGAIVDIPNERSSHSVPTPRTGGIGIMAAALLTWLLFAAGSTAAAVVAAGFLSGISFLDDARGLSVRARLLVQGSVAALFLALAYQGPWFLLLPALLAIVWMANLYNFMDGSDGLAGGMTLFGFGAYAVAAHQGGQLELSIVGAALAGAAAGFLVWNFHKARIFMGDSGSVPLGFLAAAVGMLGWQQGTWPMWFPVLVFSPFIADATVTLMRRYLRGERLSEAHRVHYYQRVLRMGLGHRGTALAGYALMLAVGGSALVARDWPLAGVVLLLVAWGVVLSAGMWLIDSRWRDFERKQQGHAAAEVSAS